MPTLGPILDHVGPFLLVLFRLIGLFIFAPMIGGSLVPVRVRTLLAVVFTLSMYPTLPADQQQPVAIDLFSLAPAAFGEVLIGLGIGLLAALPMYAVQLGGLVGGQQLGLGLAGIYNPALETESDVLGQLLLYVALSVFAAVGGLDLMFACLSRTFSHIPVGGAFAAPQVLGVGAAAGVGLGDVLLGMVSAGFDVALRVSTPVLCIILLETLAAAFLMKTIPQVNIMSLGFAVKVLLGLFVLIVSMGTLSEVIEDDVKATCDRIVEWSAGPPPTQAER